jgi:hypothetical protein
MTGLPVPPILSLRLMSPVGAITRARLMKAMRKNRIIAYSIAAACLISGSAIYVFFRPTTLLMFHWADALNVTHSIQLMRSSASSLEKLLPGWFVFSLPFALWVLAYLFFIEAVWADSLCWARLAWFWCVPLIAISAELAQIKQIIPGIFDWGDLATIILAVILGVSTTSILNPQKGQRET